MNTNPKTQLIVYYSYTGNNRLLAAHLSNDTGIRAVAIAEVRKRNGLRIALDVFLKRVPRIQPLPVSLQNFDHIIFMAPLWSGKIASPLKALLLRESHNVHSYSFVTLCGGYEKAGQLTTVRSELIELIGKEPLWMNELDVSDLLPKEQRTKIKTVSGYRVQQSDLINNFRTKIMEIESEIQC